MQSAQRVGQRNKGRDELRGVAAARPAARSLRPPCTVTAQRRQQGNSATETDADRSDRHSDRLLRSIMCETLLFVSLPRLFSPS